MDIENFRTALLSRFTQFQQVLATPQGDWTVKGFVDVYRNVYTIIPYRNLAEYWAWRERAPRR